MSRFYVGQRVRILWSTGWPELAGQEGVIVAAADGYMVAGARSQWIVAPDAWGSHFSPREGTRGGGRFGPHSDQLAPAYDGNQLVEWSECLWQPEGQAA